MPVSTQLHPDLSSVSHLSVHISVISRPHWRHVGLVQVLLLGSLDSAAVDVHTSQDHQNRTTSTTTSNLRYAAYDLT